MRSIPELCLPCRMAQQRRERWTTYAVQEDISRPRKKHPIEVLQSRTREPRASLAAGAISRQDKRARIIPTVGINAANSAMPMHTVVPPNLNMRAGVGGWWEVMDQARAAHHVFCCPGREQALADERSSD